MTGIGVQIEGATLKWAKVKRVRKKLIIEQLRIIALSEASSVFVADKKNEDRHFPSLVSGLESCDVLIREIQVPRLSRKKTLEILPFQLEPQIPYPLEEAVVSLQSFSSVEKDALVMAFIAKKQTIQEHVSALASWGVFVEEVSCASAALLRFASAFGSVEEDNILFHVGSQHSTFLYVQQQKILFSHSFAIGSSHFIEASSQGEESLGAIDFLQESSLHPGMRALLVIMAKEWDRFFSCLQSKYGISPSCEVLLTGTLATFPKFLEWIVVHLPEGVSLRQEEDGAEFFGYDFPSLAAYAVPIGLAMEGLIIDDKTLSFLQGESVPVCALCKKGKALSYFALAIFAFTATCFGLETIHLEQKKEALWNTIEMVMPGLSLEKASSLSQIENLIEKEAKIRQTHQVPYMLSPSHLSVAELLAYISDFPEEIEVRHVSYELLTYPQIAFPKAPFLAKIALHMDIKDPLLAQEVRRKLEEEALFVDLSKEFSWKAEETLYKVSFFLRCLYEERHS